jgi:hypothetical protein
MFPRLGTWGEARVAARKISTVLYGVFYSCFVWAAKSKNHHITNILVILPGWRRDPGVVSK